jgi:ribosomal protein S9
VTRDAREVERKKVGLRRAAQIVLETLTAVKRSAESARGRLFRF